MGEQRGKDGGPPRLEDLAGRLLGSVLDLGWALWETAREVADFSVRALRAAADVLLDSGLPPPGGDDDSAARDPGAPGRSAGLDRSRHADAPPAESGSGGTDAPPGSKPARREPDTRDPFSPALPEDLQRDRLVAVERDPDTLFAWWDVTRETRDRARSELGLDGIRPGGALRSVLRVTVDGGSAREIDLPAFASSAYVERPGDRTSVEITLGLARDGRFARLAGPFVVAARPVPVGRPGPTWRAVGTASGESAFPGQAMADGASPGSEPSPEERERLVALALGLVATGSPPWPGGRGRDHDRVPGHGASPGLPSSR